MKTAPPWKVGRHKQWNAPEMQIPGRSPGKMSDTSTIWTEIDAVGIAKPCPRLLESRRAVLVRHLQAEATASHILHSSGRQKCSVAPGPKSSVEALRAATQTRRYRTCHHSSRWFSKKSTAVRGRKHRLAQTTVATNGGTSGWKRHLACDAGR